MRNKVSKYILMVFSVIVIFGLSFIIILYNNESYLISRAQSTREKDNLDSAVKYYHRVLKINPKNQESVVSIIELYVELEQIDNAIEYLELFLEEMPNSIALNKTALTVYKGITTKEIDIYLKMLDIYSNRDADEMINKTSSKLINDYKFDDSDVFISYFNTLEDKEVKEYVKQYMEMGYKNIYLLGLFNEIYRYNFDGEIREKSSVNFVNLSLIEEDSDSFVISAEQRNDKEFLVGKFYLVDGEYLKDPFCNISKGCSVGVHYTDINFETKDAFNKSLVLYCSRQKCESLYSYDNSLNFYAGELGGKVYYSGAGSIAATSYDERYILTYDFNTFDGKDNLVELYDTKKKKVLYSKYYSESSFNSLINNRQLNNHGAVSDDGKYIALDFLLDNNVINIESNEKYSLEENQRIHLFAKNGKPLVTSTIDEENSLMELNYHYNDEVITILKNDIERTDYIYRDKLSERIIVVTSQNSFILEKGVVKQIDYKLSKSSGYADVNIHIVEDIYDFLEKFGKFDLIVEEESITQIEHKETDCFTAWGRNWSGYLGINDPNIGVACFSEESKLVKRINDSNETVLDLEMKGSNLVSIAYMDDTLYAIESEGYIKPGELVIINDEIKYTKEFAHQVFKHSDEIYTVLIDKDYVDKYSSVFKSSTIYNYSNGMEVVYESDEYYIHKVISHGEGVYIIDFYSGQNPEKIASRIRYTKDFVNFDIIFKVKYGYSAKFEKTIVD